MTRTPDAHDERDLLAFEMIYNGMLIARALIDKLCRMDYESCKKRCDTIKELATLNVKVAEALYGKDSKKAQELRQGVENMYNNCLTMCAVKDSTCAKLKAKLENSGDSLA